MKVDIRIVIIVALAAYIIGIMHSSYMLNDKKESEDYTELSMCKGRVIFQEAYILNGCKPTEAKK